MEGRWLATLLTPLVVLAASAARADDEVPQGAVVTVGPERPDDEALRAARAAGGARWRAEHVTPRPARVVQRPEQDIERLSALYLEADFLRCLTALQAPGLDVETLLARRWRDLAARVLVLGAACAAGAGDLPLAQRWLRRAYLAELDVHEALAGATPELAALAEGEQREVESLARVDVVVRTRPVRAALAVDGLPRRCSGGACRFSVRTGEHLLVVESLGRSPRQELVRVEPPSGAGPPTPQEVALALDAAPADQQRVQLGEALAVRARVDDVVVAAAAADAFGTRVVVLLSRRSDRVQAVLFDRLSGRIVARANATGRRATTTAVGAVVHEWRGQVEPTPLLARPLFWVITVGTAAAAGVLVYLVTRPAERRYELVVP